MSRRRLGIGLVAVAAIVAVVAVEIATSGSSAEKRAAPELPSQVLKGPRVDLAALRGKPALINFWASWCDPCRDEAPELERFARSLDGRGRLVGVDWNDRTDNALAFIREFGLTYPILRDSSQQVGTAYGLSGLPTTFSSTRRAGSCKRSEGRRRRARFKLPSPMPRGRRALEATNCAMAGSFGSASRRVRSCAPPRRRRTLRRRDDRDERSPGRRHGGDDITASPGGGRPRPPANRW
jgi:cytochrome c biogenesis protein CcmG, thiol:disulfide interchange protein DsbE